VCSSFFGSLNGTKAEPQQSKLSFSKKATANKKEAKNEAEDETPKAEQVVDVKAKVEEDDQSDTNMLAGGEQTQVLKQENGGDKQAEKAVRKKVSFKDGDSSSKKRAVSEEKQQDSDDEPPTKKQRRKSEAKAEEQSHGKSIKTEPVDSDSDLDRDDMQPVEQQKPRNKNVKQESVNPGSTPQDVRKSKAKAPSPASVDGDKPAASESDAQSDAEAAEESEEEEKPEEAAKAREKVQTTLKSIGKDLYPDWKAGDPVPYAALCTTFSKIELTSKRLEITAHCSLFLRQVLRLTPKDLLPTVLLMLGKLAADYAGVELGIGESLIMKAIGETTGRTLQVIKADQQEIGDLGLVAAKSRGNQPTMFKPKPLTVRGVHEGLMQIALVEGSGSQGRKVAGIKKLLSAADVQLAGKGKSGVDITKDKGGASESKFIVRTLEGKMRLGLAEKTILVALANAAVHHDFATKGKKEPGPDQIGKGEQVLKNVYK